MKDNRWEYGFGSEYPKKMVENITNKVKSMERRPLRAADTSNSSILIPASPVKDRIRVISTYGSDDTLVDIVKSIEPELLASRSFSSSESLTTRSSDSRPSQDNQPPSDLFSFMKRTGTSLRKKLVKVRHLAVSGESRTVRCNRKNCGTCDLIAGGQVYVINNKRVKPANGDCRTYNVVYCFMCNHLNCNKNYVGRTVQHLKSRVNEHRSKFYKLLSDPDLISSREPDDDSYSLGAHLILDHGCHERGDFNSSYKIFILKNCSPRALEECEHRFIQSLRTIKPFGINSVDPFGLPLLDPP